MNMARSGYCQHGIAGPCVYCENRIDELKQETKSLSNKLKMDFLELLKNDADFRKQIKEALEK